MAEQHQARDSRSKSVAWHKRPGGQGVLVAMLLLLTFIAGVFASGVLMPGVSPSDSQPGPTRVSGLSSSPVESAEAGLDEPGPDAAVSPMPAPGPEQIPVPDLVGRSREAAEASLRAAGLTAKVLTTVSDGAPEGRVLAQIPRAGRTLLPGDVVELTVAQLATVQAAHGSMSVLSEAPAAGKTVALTIDLGDTATRQSVTAILDDLSRRQVTCTFFVTGWFIENHPALVDEIVNRGHDIGNHTDTHPHCPQISSDAFRDELRTVERLLSERGLAITPPKYYRPPYGEYNRTTTSVAAEMGYRTVMWSTTSVDWDPSTDPDVATKRVLSGAGPGGIILTHATPVSMAMIPQVLDNLQERGYTVTSLNGLMQAAGRP